MQREATSADRAVPRGWGGPRARVFALTWIAYASYYLGRKNFSLAKTTLEEQLGFTRDALAWVDTGYLAGYAAGQFLMGVLGDRLGPRRLVGAGMMAAAALVAISGSATTALAVAIPFALNGVAQSSGWPGTVKAMTPWFRSSERGRVMGLWSTCYQVGGLASGAIGAALLKHYGWRVSFFLPAVWIALVGGAILLALPEAEASTGPARQAAQLRLVRDPTLWSLGLAYFCLKLIRYSLLFWLPYYLERSVGMAREHAGFQSLAFEGGGVIGAVAVGAISDRLLGGRRGLAGLCGCVGLALALLLYVVIGRAGAAANFLGLAAVGMLLFGPDALISGAAAQDAGGNEAAATAAGFINGMGSIGAVLQGLLTSRISARYGWDALFEVFVALAFLAAVAMLPRALTDRRRNSQGIGGSRPA